jgi:hypothetical protein
MPANKPITMFDVISPTIAVAIENPLADARSTTDLALAGLSSYRVNAIVEL